MQAELFHSPAARPSALEYSLPPLAPPSFHTPPPSSTDSPLMTPVDDAPLDDFWAVSFSEAEAYESDFIAPHGMLNSRRTLSWSLEAKPLPVSKDYMNKHLRGRRSRDHIALAQ